MLATKAYFVLACFNLISAQFLPQCTTNDDYGWPRFNNSQQLENSQWASYFMTVYGELPVVYPICVYDLWNLNKGAYLAAGLGGTRPLVNTSDVHEGDLYLNGMGWYAIYHEKWRPIPNNTWVEVTHTVYPTELQGAWAFNTRGSGIWYNVGRTLVFPTPADPTKIHAEAITFLRQNCSIKISNEWHQLESDIFGGCASEKGYDSVQFEPQAGEIPLGTFGLAGLTELVFSKIDGNKGCGVANPSDTPLRAGWEASRQCKCENKPIAPSCGLMPQPPFPFNVIGEEPRLCGLREHNLSAFCSGYTCTNWVC